MTDVYYATDDGFKSVREMNDGGGYGIWRYDPMSLKKEIILRAVDRPLPKREPFDMELYGDVLYYVDWISEEDDRVCQELFRVDLDTGKTADLGDYLGYTHIIVNAGYIWNYYGFLNPNASELWEDHEDFWIRCDPDNQNPEYIPVRHEPCADLGGYVMPRAELTGNSLRYLLYVGEEDEPHVWENTRDIVYWSGADGRAVERVGAHDGELDILYFHDYRTGEDCRLLEDWDPGDEERIPSFTRMVGERYAIFAMCDVQIMRTGGAAFGNSRYYLRVDLETGETARILPTN